MSTFLSLPRYNPQNWNHNHNHHNCHKRRQSSRVTSLHRTGLFPLFRNPFRFRFHIHPLLLSRSKSRFCHLGLHATALPPLLLYDTAFLPLVARVPVHHHMDVVSPSLDLSPSCHLLFLLCCTTLSIFSIHLVAMILRSTGDTTLPCILVEQV